jgi:hypothetical protein
VRSFADITFNNQDHKFSVGRKILQWNPVWFEWAHLYLWQALIMLDGLIHSLVDIGVQALQ